MLKSPAFSGRKSNVPKVSANSYRKVEQCTQCAAVSIFHIHLDQMTNTRQHSLLVSGLLAYVSDYCNIMLCTFPEYDNCRRKYLPFGFH